MAKLIESKCKQCRRMNEKLFLRGERCFGAKCAMVRRAYAPGVHGKTRRRGGLSEFGQQLKQKQRVKRFYGTLERQFKKYFLQAEAQKGDTRENLLRRLEMRLDNVVFRLGWGKSRATARQMVNHGHLLINGRRMTIPSYQVEVGDIISLKEKIKKSKLMENLAATLKKHEEPKWLLSDKEKIEAKVVSAPGADELGDLTRVGLIVEFYSR